MREGREQWGSKIGFILATTGAAVGLGNVWRFPYIVGTGGGGVFVILFLILLVLIGIPLMIGELALGRASRRNPVGAFHELGVGRRWQVVGYIQLAAGFIILSYYGVISGWAFAYIFRTAGGLFVGLEEAEVAQEYAVFVGEPLRPVLWQALFIGLTVLVVIRGISQGIERWSKVLVPLFLVLILYMLGTVLTTPGAWDGVVWFLRPNFELLTLGTVLSALGQVFFTLSLGMGAILTYGSYLDEGEDIPVNATLISLADVILALLIGLVVIPAVFAFGFEPDAGPELIFITLPAIFNQMPQTRIVGTLFFSLLTIAALTSASSLLEVSVSYLKDEYEMDRGLATFLAGGAVFLAGVPSSLSQGALPLTVFGSPFLDFVDYVASNFLLPAGGLMMAIFIGWFWTTRSARRELEKKNRFGLVGIWEGLVRYVIPIALFVIFLSSIL